MILFIDTEWADVPASELVSLALVSDCGRYEFDAERDPLPAKPTDFVRSVVYPLLDHGPRALPDDQFTASLHRFFDDALEIAPHGKVLIAYQSSISIAPVEPCFRERFVGSRAAARRSVDPWSHALLV